MKRALGVVLLAAAVAVPGLALADDAPSGPPSASVYAGPCLSPALSGPKSQAEIQEGQQESAIIGALLSAAVPKLIDAGLDFIGGKLAKLAADEKTVLQGSRASQLALTPRYCLQIIKWAGDGAPLNGLLAPLVDPSTAPALAQDTRPTSFLMEFWVRPSQSGKAVSLVPTLLYYPKQLASAKNGKPATLTVSANLAPFDATATSSTWILPQQELRPEIQTLVAPRNENGKLVRLRWGELMALCERACDTASPWVANPWIAKGGSDGDGPALAANVAVAPKLAAPQETAVNLGLDITEVRAGSKFFKLLSDGWNESQPTIQSWAEARALASARQKAQDETDAASATAALTASSKLEEADASQQKYCATAGKSGVLIQAAAAELYSKQINANLAAKAAGVSPPYPTVITIASTLDKSLCP